MDTTLATLRPPTAGATFVYKKGFLRATKTTTVSLRPFDLAAQVWAGRAFETEDGKEDGLFYLYAIMRGKSELPDDVAIDAVYQIVYHLLEDKTDFKGPTDFRRSFKSKKGRPLVKFDAAIFRLLASSIANALPDQDDIPDEDETFGKPKKKNLTPRPCM